MGKFQAAIEQLKKNDFTRLKAYPPSPPSPRSPPSSIPTTIVSSSKRPKCNIPDNFELENLYNPRYSVFQLISTRKHPRKQVIPPRPPNSFFLFKNCYMLELRKLGYRYCMPDVCRQAKQLWSNIPPEVKERYDIFALQAQILHQEMYPEYKFSPKKRQTPKQKKLSSKTTNVESSMLSTFSITNFLGSTTNNLTTENIATESFQLLSPPSTPSTNLSSFSSPTNSPPHELINELIIPQPNSVDYNNLFYLNNCYLNSLNNVLTQNSPISSPEAPESTIYSQIMNPLEFLSYSDNSNAFNFN